MKTSNNSRLSLVVMTAACALALPLGAQVAADPESPTTRARPAYNAEANNQRDDRAGKNRATTQFQRSDRRVVEKLASCNEYEIALSRQAAGRAANAQVRSYAEQIVRDHERVGRELTTLAARHGLTLSTTPKHQDDVDDVAKESKGEYDEAYLEEIIDSHEKAVKLLEKASKSKNSDLAAFAVQHLPAMKEHLDRAEELEEVIDD